MNKIEAKQSMKLVYRHALESLSRDIDFTERKIVASRDLQERAFNEMEVRWQRKVYYFVMGKVNLIA